MDTIGWDIGYFTKYQQEHDGGKDGLYYMPERPENGLLVLSNKITFHKKQQQVTVLPYFFQVKVEQPAFRLNYEIPMFRPFDKLRLFDKLRMFRYQV
jgi:hypothetical protein